MESESLQSILISVEELASRIFEEDKKTIKAGAFDNFKIIDVSGGGDAALEGFHAKAIPNALFINVINDLKDKEAKYPNTFPPESVVKEVLEGVGINKTDELVLYTNPGKFSAGTRAYIILSHYGLNVKLLDGGLKKYEELGYPTQEGIDFSGEKTTIDSLETSEDTLISLSDMHDFEEGKNDSIQVVDCRPPKSFNGEATDNIEGCRQGNIKGAVNIPSGEFLNEDGTFKSEEGITELFEKYKLDSEKETV